MNKIDRYSVTDGTVGGLINTLLQAIESETCKATDKIEAIDPEMDDYYTVAGVLFREDRVQIFTDSDEGEYYDSEEEQ